MRLSNGAYFAGRRACRQKTEVNARLGVIVLGFIVGVPIGLLVFLVSGFSMPAALAAFVLWFAYLNRQRKREMLQRMTPAAFSINLHRRPIEKPRKRVMQASLACEKGKHTLCRVCYEGPAPITCNCRCHRSARM